MQRRNRLREQKRVNKLIKIVFLLCGRHGASSATGSPTSRSFPLCLALSSPLTCNIFGTGFFCAYSFATFAAVILSPWPRVVFVILTKTRGCTDFYCCAMDAKRKASQPSLLSSFPLTIIGKEPSNTEQLRANTVVADINLIDSVTALMSYETESFGMLTNAGSDHGTKRG